MAEKTMTLTLTTPDASRTATVDAVSFTVPDGSSGTGGGSVGIRPGHTAALMAVAEGEVVARLRGEEILRARVDGGFATVDGESVTVFTNRIE